MRVPCMQVTEKPGTPAPVAAKAEPQKTVNDDEVPVDALVARKRSKNIMLTPGEECQPCVLSSFVVWAIRTLARRCVLVCMIVVQVV